MKKCLNLLLALVFSLSLCSQCSDVGIQISSSSETSVALYHAGFFLIPSGFDNVCDWEVVDFSGNTIHEATTTGEWADQSFSLFDHMVPITDSMQVSLTITNETSGILCEVSDTLFWELTEVLPDVFIGNWAVLSNNGGIETDVLGIEVESSDDISCFAGSDGSITLQGFNGQAPYLFAIDGGVFVSSSTFIGLSAGSYTVVIMDANGDMSSITVTLDQPEELILGTEPTDVTCFGGENGAISASSIGGVEGNGYSYFIDGAGPFSSGIFSGLIAGSYIVSVQDGNDCIVTETVVLAQSDQIEVEDLMITDVTCAGAANGSIDLNVTGGVGSYIYTIEGQASTSTLPIDGLVSGAYSLMISDENDCITSIDFSVLGTDSLFLEVTDVANANCQESNSGAVSLVGSGGNQDYTYMVAGMSNATGIFDSISYGEYVATIIDGNGCSAEVAFEVGTDADFDVSYDITDANCQGDATGIISVVIDGGDQGFTFYLDGEESTSATFEDVSAGDYELAIESANGCMLVTTITVFSASSLEVDMVEIINIDCSAGTSGQVTIQAIGGAGAVSYGLAGETNASGIFAGLGEGTYSASVTDSLGCAAQQEVIIISEGQIVVEITEVQGVSCHDQVDGMIILSVSGSTGMFTYQLDSTVNTSGIFTDLAPGSYTAMVSHAQDCISEIDFEILSVDALEIALLNIVGDDGSGNGSATVESTGGTAPYQYSIDGGLTFQSESIFTGLMNESYTILVLDANGCENSIEVLLTSIHDVIAAVDVRIHPSPISRGAMMTVSANRQIKSISVLNNMGQALLSLEGNNLEVRWDTSPLPNGTYMIGVRIDGGTIWKRAIIVE